MNDDLEVDAGGMRACAAGLTATAARATAGSAQAPSPVALPRWATSDAAELAADSARHRLTALGADVAEMARQIIAAVTDYDDADERAAERLRRTR